MAVNINETFLQRFFSSHGRMNRQRFFTSILILMIPAMILGGIGFVSGEQGEKAPALYTLINQIITLFLIYPTTIIMIKRFHDLGYSAVVGIVISIIGNIGQVAIMFGLLSPSLFTILSFISFPFMVVALLFLLFKKGTVGENEYGQDPLGGKSFAEVYKFASAPAGKGSTAPVKNYTPGGDVDLSMDEDVASASEDKSSEADDAIISDGGLTLSEPAVAEKSPKSSASTKGDSAGSSKTFSLFE
ncbi:MAG: DUF805 domain-containing protein [Alphaproteobacteria bacterium]|nr:DUF805 domain-containing protein [Alphaproteobacteria bacterium]